MAPRPCRAVLFDQVGFDSQLTNSLTNRGQPAGSCIMPCMLAWETAPTLLVTAQDTPLYPAPPQATSPRPTPPPFLPWQDIMHRVSAPLPAAGPRPRFSLVWKLALLPRAPGQALCVARREWGPPTSFGSAARVDAVKRHLAAERRGAAAAAPSYTSLPSSLV